MDHSYVSYTKKEKKRKRKTTIPTPLYFSFLQYFFVLFVEAFFSTLVVQDKRYFDGLNWLFLVNQIIKKNSFHLFFFFFRKMIV